MTLFDLILQALLSGLTMGCLYAIAGLGFMIFLSVTNLFNFAQGEFCMLGAMIAAVAYDAGLGIPVSLLLAVIVSCAAGGILWQLFLRRSVAQDASHMTLVFITIGFSLLAKGGAFLAWGTSNKEFPYFASIPPLHFGGAVVSPQAPWIWGTMVVLVLGLAFLFDYTMMGKALRASADRPLAARLVGIRPASMALFALVLAAGLAGAGAVVLAPMTMANYGSGLALTIKSSVAATVGGITRAQGVIVGGLTMALIESFTNIFISSSYTVIIAMSLFIIILLFRPQGLIGPRETEV